MWRRGSVLNVLGWHLTYSGQDIRADVMWCCNVILVFTCVTIAGGGRVQNKQQRIMTIKANNAERKRAGKAKWTGSRFTKSQQSDLYQPRTLADTAMSSKNRETHSKACNENRNQWLAEFFFFLFVSFCFCCGIFKSAPNFSNARGFNYGTDTPFLA